MRRILLIFLGLIGFLTATIGSINIHPLRRDSSSIQTPAIKPVPTPISRFDVTLADTGPADMTRAERDSVLRTPFGMQYTESTNEWSFYGVMTAVGEVNVWGSPGLATLIAYSLDGREIHFGWAVIEVDGYEFRTYHGVPAPGVKVRLHITGTYVSANGINLEKCQGDKDFCMLMNFVEGGFPVSSDYGSLTISPSNELIHSGYLPNDWWNGMLCWPMDPIVESPNDHIQDRHHHQQ